MHAHRLVVLAAAGLACVGAQALTLVSSNFDTGTEGWTAINGVQSPGASFVASGGVSGGYVSATDGSPRRVWLWDAPSAYLGDQSAAYGGTLSYAMMLSTQAGDVNDSIPDVKLVGAGLELVADAGARPGLSWTGYTLSLTPGIWHIGTLDGALASAADLMAVLGQLEALRLRGEYSTLARDSGALDSVLLASVPEPGTWALALAGLLAIGSRLRRRS